MHSLLSSWQSKPMRAYHKINTDTQSIYKTHFMCLMCTTRPHFNIQFYYLKHTEYWFRQQFHSYSYAYENMAYVQRFYAESFHLKTIVFCNFWWRIPNPLNLEQCSGLNDRRQAKSAAIIVIEIFINEIFDARTFSTFMEYGKHWL